MYLLFGQLEGIIIYLIAFSDSVTQMWLTEIIIIVILAMLRVSPVGIVCPDSTITFTCDGESTAGSGSIIRWTATLGGREIVQFTFFPNSQSSNKVYHGLLWNASATTSPFRSTLSTTTAIHLNGTVVECGGSGIQSQRIPIVVARELRYKLELSKVHA